MAAGEEFKGNNVVSEFNNVDISTTLTQVEISEEATEPKEIDVTHRGDSQMEALEGLPGKTKGRVTMQCWDEKDGVSAIYGFNIGDKYPLDVYPEDKVSGKPVRSIALATLLKRTQPIQVEQAVNFSLEFSFIGTVTKTTYTP
jgi:hypothetical protein